MRKINLLSLALGIFTSFASQAQPGNNNQPYFPINNGEEISAAYLFIDDQAKIINCEIGLNDGPTNVETKPGRISFKRSFGDSKNITVEFGVPQEQRPLFSELKNLLQFIELPPSVQTPFKSRGFVDYGFKVDDHVDRRTAWPASAYNGSIIMEIGGHTRVSSESDDNKRAAILIHSLCETARVRFNSRYPEISVRTLRPEGEKVRENYRDEQRAYERIPTWRRWYNKARNYL